MYNYPCLRHTQPSGLGNQPAPMFPMPAIGTTLPTGMPAGPIMTPMPNQVPPTPPIPPAEPQTLQDTAFLPGYLKTQIGKLVRLQLLIGTTGPLVDRIGTLLAVGANYVLMQPQNSDNLLTSDLYSIKFVEIYR